jgi:hypothetical protein
MLEKERIYRRDHSENIKLFKDIKSKEKYSGYALELNRIFGQRCYDHFYKNLFINRRIHANNFKKMFEKPIKKGGLKIIQEPFNINEFNTCIKKMELKKQQYEYKIKHPHILKSSPYQKSKELAEKKSKILGKKINLPDIPDIGRYNPNYEAINTHSYLPSFSSLDYENFKKFKKNSYAHDNNSDKKINIETDYKLKRYKSLKNNRFNNDIFNKNTEFNDSQSNISQYLSTSSFGDEKNNHCLKFDSYSPRKPLINKVMYTTELSDKNKKNKRFSRNLKGVIDFNKASNSNYGTYFDIIARNINNPPLGMYQPKYDCIEEKTRNIYLGKKEPSSQKLAKLKKILCNFNISLEYKLNPSLNSYNTINYDFDNNK